MRRLIVAVVFIAVTFPVFATEPNPSSRQRELIEQLLDAMNIDRMSSSVLDSMYKQIEGQFLAEAEARGNDPDDIEEAKELFGAFRERSQKIPFGDLLREAQIRIYAKYFTEHEIEDLAAFYASPTGKKMIEVMPQMMSEGMKAGIDLLGPKIQEVMAQVVEEQEQKRPWRRTMADMRSLATAVEAYATDQDDESYPPATDLASLKAALDGITMSEKFPEKDMWGHAYEYVVAPDRHHYRIVSAGADGIFEWDSRRIEVPKDGAVPSVRYRERLEDDLIYGDGVFIQLPVQSKPKNSNQE
jgi:hypothetical protein